MAKTEKGTTNKKIGKRYKSKKNQKKVQPGKKNRKKGTTKKKKICFTKASIDGVVPA